MTKIKICGIKTLNEIQMMNQIKPDFIGFVFAKGRHQISVEQAKSLKEKTNSDIKVVGVFFNDEINLIIKIYQLGIIDIVQLHGDENQFDIQRLKNKGIPIINRLLSDHQLLKTDFFMLDSGNGSGKTLDWNQLQIENSNQLFIAGGINVSNISKVIKQLNPFAVDISTGAELNGSKNKEITAKLVHLVHIDKGE